MFTKNDDNDSSFYRVTRKNCYFYMQLKKHEQIEKYAAKQEAKKSEFFIKRCEFYRFGFIGKSE